MKENAFGLFKDSIKLILDVLYPPKCIFCEKILNVNKKTEPICDVCLKHLPYCKNYICCKTCSVPIIKKNKFNLCDECLIYERNFKKNISVFLYIGKIRKTILRYKKMRKIFYSIFFAKLMSESVIEKYKNINFDYIVTVPIAKKKLIERGFDQIHEISKYMEKYLNIKYLKHALKKSNNTHSQKGLNYYQRQISQAGKIKIKLPKKISNKTILIVDDVFTTGATIAECTKILKLCGAQDVYCVSLARTVKNDKYFKIDYKNEFEN
ncbi:MAG: double zinc ribbon domain-containing protein [Clostridiales bacterium]|jgi:ComF family protein|nr:double zinc ribbon domain-containing protein [Clostridiales bacterium]